MREMEFKMERQGQVSVGQEIEVTEGQLPMSYYYTIVPAVAMSANFAPYERLRSRKGVVRDIRRNERGYYVVAEFDEEPPAGAD